MAPFFRSNAKIGEVDKYKLYSPPSPNILSLSNLSHQINFLISLCETLHDHLFKKV